MSNWTHAAGVIRIDALRIDDAPDPDFDELIGRELRFHDPAEVWMAAEEHPERFMPLGSEGSLTKAVWVNPQRNHMAAYAVTVFGDLRDHDDPQGVVDWFKALCAKLGPHVRQATITVHNEVLGQVDWSTGR